MTGIERLIPTNQLKTTLLVSLKNQRHQLFFQYDREFDALMLQIVSPEVETVVHYIDDHVALLYRADDLEIVGLQMEDFERSFVPNHVNVQKVWRLSETRTKLENVADMILAVERQKTMVAREVAKAAEPLVGEPAGELAASIA